MNFIIYFLLISGLSILITKSNSAKTGAIIKEHVQDFIENEQPGNRYPMWLLKDGWLGETEHSLVWKGIYENETIAVKITADESCYRYEMGAYHALDAKNNPNIEEKGIPRVYFNGKAYFNGKISDRYFVIVMTLLSGTLEERWKKAGSIPELNILLICKQAVRTLEYISDKQIVHNDIKPANIFFRGSKVFICDFNTASSFGHKGGHTPWFASSNFYLGKNRYPMDDLESLVLSLWYIAGVPRDRPIFFKFRDPLGKTLAKCKKNGKAKKKMLEKCSYFKNPNVQEAFILIVEEMLQPKTIPNHKMIIDILTDAIEKVLQIQNNRDSSG